MRRRATTAWALAAIVLIIPLAGVGLALLRWFPEMASLHGSGVQRMLDFTLLATGVFFVLGHLALAWAILRPPTDRSSSPPRAPREWIAGVVPALVMAVVAEGGIVALGLPVWATYYGPPPAEAMTVEVTGRQFFWVVRLPGGDGRFGRTSPSLVGTENPLGLDKGDAAAADDVVLLNELHVPANRPVRVQLRSLDVIHSFFVPELRLKQDAVPGMTVTIWFVPTRIGRFEIACNQICGLGHYRMRGTLDVSEEGEFQAWLGRQSPSLGM